jgi:aspartyl-tRNA(Asn)/glutamyl-tRNA(Gln) amidotransferase subunit C
LVILANSMAHLSKDDILKLAALCKLQLTEEQITKFQSELESILGYVEQLQSVDVSGLEPTNQVSGLTNVTRPDEIVEYAPKDELLKNLPQREADLIKVNRVLE